MTNKSLVIGADIGGTHITAALVDIDNKTILTDSLAREKVDADASAAQIIEVWSKAIAHAAQDRASEILSLAMPGPFDYDRGISLMKGQGKYDQLYMLNVKELLAAQLQFKPENISMLNDAASFLQGEVFTGAASGCSKAFGVTLGTGLGTCIFQNNVSEDAGLWNSPFNESIAEDYLCTRWFVRRYWELTKEKITGVRDLLTKKENNDSVLQIFNEFGENLAKFLVKYIDINQPEVVVIGGNIAKSYDYFKEPLSRIVHQKFPGIPIRTACLGEQAALLGAASYWDNRYNMNKYSQMSSGILND